MNWQVRRGTLEFPNEAGDLGELERKLLEKLEGTVMPAIEEVDKVCHSTKENLSIMSFILSYFLHVVLSMGKFCLGTNVDRSPLRIHSSNLTSSVSIKELYGLALSHNKPKVLLK